ncbi:MAG: metalloprotease RseP [Bacteroidota bacterium]|jgi:regulator of sigma E protease
MIQLFLMLLSLAILVALHELGHFVAARMFKIRVERFYLFFDFLFPLPNVMKFALFKKKIGDTEYGLGWFPLGGYVQISGMVDESMDLETLKEEPKPWEFRSKPAWQRLIVMMGGIIVNVILGIVIFTCLTYFHGTRFTPMSEINKYGIVSYELGKYVGLETGDKILKFNGEPVKEFTDVLNMDKLLQDNSYYTVERNGKVIQVSIPDDFANVLAKNQKSKEPKQFITQKIPFEVGKLVDTMAAAKAGIKVGDKIIDVAANRIVYFNDLQDVLKLNKNKVVPVKVDREGTIVDLQVKVNKEGKIGFAPKILLKDSILHYTFSESIVAGSKQAFGIITGQLNGFAKLFTGKLNPRYALGGVVSMYDVFPSDFDWVWFWGLTGAISMSLAFMNFLPIPALDGGHVIILMYEIISGKKPSDKFLETTQRIGTVILLTLMVTVLFIDLLNKFSM